MRFSLVTDHWQYTSIIGINALIVGLGAWIWGRWQSKVRQLGTIFAVALIGLLCVLTWVRCHAFKDLETLWRDTISKNPEAWMAHSNLGSILISQGRFEEAIGHCSTALRMNPGNAWIHGARGVSLSKTLEPCLPAKVSWTRPLPIFPRQFASDLTSGRRNTA